MHTLTHSSMCVWEVCSLTELSLMWLNYISLPEHQIQHGCQARQQCIIQFSILMRTCEGQWNVGVHRASFKRRDKGGRPREGKDFLPANSCQSTLRPAKVRQLWTSVPMMRKTPLAFKAQLQCRNLCRWSWAKHPKTPSLNMSCLVLSWTPYCCCSQYITINKSTKMKVSC